MLNTPRPVRLVPTLPTCDVVVRRSNSCHCARISRSPIQLKKKYIASGQAELLPHTSTKKNLTPDKKNARASARTSAWTPAPLSVSRSTRGLHRPSNKERKDARRLRFGRTQPRRRMDALPTPGEMMQQKVGRRYATPPDLLLKHPNATIATYV